MRPATCGATNFYDDSVSEVSGAGGTVAAGGPFLDASLRQPNGIAIDGAGNMWVANFGGDGVTELAGAGGVVPGSALSPAGGWASDAGLNETFGVAIDASGDVWLSNFAAGPVTELIGAAAPVRTPLLGPVQQP